MATVHQAPKLSLSSPVSSVPSSDAPPTPDASSASLHAEAASTKAHGKMPPALAEAIAIPAAHHAPYSGGRKSGSDARNDEVDVGEPSLHMDAILSSARDSEHSFPGYDALHRLHSQYRSSKNAEVAGEGEGNAAEGDEVEGGGDNDEEEHFFLKGDEEDEEVADSIHNCSRSASTSSTGKSEPRTMTTEEKLQALQMEFGPSHSCQLSGEEERIIADEPAALFRKVLIRGYAIMTNHRFCFIAYLPSQLSKGHGKGILKQGLATIHRPGLTTRRRRVWLVLSNHSMTAYPSSDELYEPLGGCILSQLTKVAPFKHSLRHTHAVELAGKGRPVYFDFETEESASSWLKEIEVARWRLRHDVDKVRIAVPLVRITNTRLEEYLQAFTLLHMDVCDESLFLSSGHSHHKYLPHARAKTDAHAPSPMTTTEVVFGLNRDSTMSTRLQEALKKSCEWRALTDRSEWWSLPSPIIEIDGPEADQHSFTLNTTEEHDSKSMQQRMVDVFSLDCRPEDVQLVKADLVRTIPHSGTLAISPRYLCFFRRRRLTGMADTRIRIPLEHLKKVYACKAFRWHHYGIRIQVHAHEDVLFEMMQEKHRDRTIQLIKEAIEEAKKREQSRDGRKQDYDNKSHLTPMGLALASQANHTTVTLSPATINDMPRAVNVCNDSRPVRIAPIKIICLTIGSRGDVQPYIALCKQLQQHDHECIIVSHDEYEDWVKGYGIGFRPAGGDPAALMKLMSDDNNFFSPQFLREAISKFRHWLDELLRQSMEACWDADLIIESPSTFAGIHIAEAIGAYYYRAFTMPWTKTSAYPQAFSVPSIDMGPQYNALSYGMFDQLLWTASSGQINRWRKHMLHLEPTDLAKLKTSTVPFMYNFSPAVVPPPLDWGNLICVTGYWTLEAGDSSYEPRKDLVEFIAKAKKDKKKLAYIGFGSITIADPKATQRAIYEAVQKSDVRAIVAKGWSERMSKKKDEDNDGPVEVPEEVYAVDSIPHDWLFPQIDMAMHHGGAGTTGASLGAGLITLIHPFFGDQYFWSGRVNKLGAGLRVKNLKMEALQEALTKARDDRVMREKAQVVGQAIRHEHGTVQAVLFIYQNLSRSKRTKRVSKERRRRSFSSFNSGSHSQQGVTTDEGESEDDTDARGIPSREQSLTSRLLSYNNSFMQAAYHPIDTFSFSLSRTKSPSSRMMSTSALIRDAEDDNMQVGSPEQLERQLAIPEEEEEVEELSEEVKGELQEEDDKVLTASPPANTASGAGEHRRSSHFSNMLNMLTFHKPLNMPHMTMPNILKLGMSSPSKETEETLSDDEKAKRKEESKQKHRSAKEEDQRRRAALEEIWRTEKRFDLLGEEDEEKEEEEEADAGGAKEEDKAKQGEQEKVSQKH